MASLTQHQAMPRRAMIRTTAGAALALSLWSLAGCNNEKPSQFRGIDVSGANYAKGFTLTDHDGSERTLQDYANKAVLIFFGFTQCPDVCPTALARAAEVKRLLGPDGDKLQVLFVTVDPERDTPEMLKSYTQTFDPSFVGLYGDAERIAEVAREYKVYYKKVPTGSSYTLDHTALSYVYDPQGKLRVVLRHEQTAEDYAADLKLILGNA